MGALFVAASSQRLVNTVPLVTAPPFTIGMWVKPAGAASACLWCSADATVNNSYFAIEQSTTTAFNLSAVLSTPTQASATITITAGQWYFIVVREILPANHRCAVLGPQGLAHGASAVSRVPTNITRMSLGSRELATPAGFFDGVISEYWLTNTDIQPDGLQLSDQTLRQLARSGPFSIPHIGNKIIEYRSLRYNVESDEDVGLDYFPGTRRVWTNTNGVIRGAHPPINEGIYRRPGDYTIPGIV